MSGLRSDSGLYSAAALSVLTLVYVLNYLDRQLLAVLAEPIRKELHLSDTELGLLTGTIFALFYATFGIPAAWLADRTNRIRLVAVACAGWSVFTALCGRAHSFAQLALARVGVGIGESGGVAPSFSVIADYFPIHRRGTAIAVFTLGIPLGSALGVAYGAWAASQFGWRSAFLSLAIPGLVLAACLPLLVKEPRRGAYDGESDTRSVSALATIRLYIRSARLRWVVTASAVSAFIMYIQLAWTPAYLMRVKGMSLAQMGEFYSPCVGAAVCLGSLFSGLAFDRLLRRTARAYGLISALSALAALPFFLAGLWISDWRLALPLLGMSQLLTVMYQVPAVAATQNLVPPAQRATASAILFFCLNSSPWVSGPCSWAVSAILRSA